LELLIVKLRWRREGGRGREDEGIGQTEDEFELGEGGKDRAVSHFVLQRNPCFVCLLNFQW